MTNLAELLKNRGMTLSDLARAMNVDKGTVSRWNKNGVPPKHLQAVEDAVGIAPCDVRPDLAHLFVKSRVQ
jgi:transcriptional regulator with XRE-family HTH domain